MRKKRHSTVRGIILMSLVQVGLSSSPDFCAALDLTPPFSIENGQVLPAGVGNPRFYQFFMATESRFSGSGQAEPLGKGLNKAVSWSEILRLQKSAVERGALLSTLREAGVDQNGSPGSTTGQVNSALNVKVPALGFGITERWTVAVAVPILTYSISVDTGFVKTGDGQLFVNQLSNLNPEKGVSAAARMNSAIDEKLNSLGYQKIQSKELTHVGDVQLISKYQFFRGEGQTATLRSNLIVPTGRAANPDAVLDTPTGGERFQFGSSLILEQTLPLSLTWTSLLGGVWQLPYSLERRIPVFINDPLSPDKEQLTKNSGGLFTAGSSLSYFYEPFGMQAGAGYLFQFQTQPTYSGGAKFESGRYDLLSGLTPVQALHTATLTAGFSTVEWYQNKKFFYPMQANFLYSHPLLGRNVPVNDVYAGELVLFF